MKIHSSHSTELKISSTLLSVQKKIMEICQSSSIYNTIPCVLLKNPTSIDNVLQNTHIALNPVTLIIDYPIPDLTEDFISPTPFNELSFSLHLIENSSLISDPTENNINALTIAEELSKTLHRSYFNLETGRAHVLLRSKTPWKIIQDKKDNQRLTIETYYQVIIFQKLERGNVL